MKSYLSKHPKLYYCMIILSCCLFMAGAIGITANTLGVFMSAIASDMHTGIGSITMIITIMSLSSAFFAPILSRLLALYPINQIMSVGILINVLSLVFLSQSHHLMFMYVFALKLGIGNCCFSLIPVTLILNHWFYKNNGLISGFCISFSGLTASIASILVTHLIAQIGWRHALLICAAVVFLLAFPPAFFIIHQNPRELGILPYGILEETEEISKEESYSTQKGLFLTLLLYAAIVSFMTSFNPNISAFGNSVGFSAPICAYMVSAAMISNVGSKLILGMLVDRFNAEFANTIMIIVSAIGFLVLCFVNVNEPVFAIAGTFLFGCIFSANAAGIPLLIKQSAGRNNYVAYYSKISVFSSIAYAIGASCIGFSYDIFHSYHFIFGVMLALVLINLCSLLRLHKMKK